jgi:hypothetical protein
MPRTFVLVVCLGLVLLRAPISAHHAFSAEFDENARVSLKGTVTKLDWVNPHCRIYLDVKGPDGKIANWAVETAAPAVLQGRGVTRDDFRPGAEVVIEAYRARNKAMTASGRIVRLHDGTELFLR